MCATSQKSTTALLVNFCFLIHFDFWNTRTYSFSVGIKGHEPQVATVWSMVLDLGLISPEWHSIKKGGSKVRVLGQEGACNSAPNGPNDLKFCMQGAFVCYYWVLVQSSSCNLYNGQACSGLQMWLASIEVTWPWLEQNSIVKSIDKKMMLREDDPSANQAEFYAHIW